MYNDVPKMAIPMPEKDMKQDAIEQLSQNLIDRFKPYEIAEILKAVLGNCKSYHAKKIENIKQDVEQLIKEFDPLLNL